MSAGYNKSIFVGNLTADPVLKSTKQGVAVCTFSIAVDRKRRSADAERVTDYFDIKTWRGLAENCYRYLRKGSKVLVDGEIHRYEFTKKDGTKCRDFEIEAEDVQFLSSRESAAAAPATYPAPTQQHGGYTPVEPPDDLPF